MTCFGIDSRISVYMDAELLRRLAQGGQCPHHANAMHGLCCDPCQ